MIKRTNLVLGFILVILLAVSSGLMAVDYFVRTDGNDGNDGSTNDSSHAWLTIQHAVDTLADPTTATIIIYVANGTYTLNSNDIDINRSFNNLTIQGENKISTIVQAHATAGSATERVFEITSGETVTIRDMTIQNGNSTSGGGGVYLHAGSTLDNCILSWNAGQYGGSVYFNSGGILNNCTISYSSSKYDGGGAYFYYGGSMDNCILNNNSSLPTYTNDGGGAYLYYGGLLENCTLSDNSGDNGGGVYFENSGTLDNCTLSGNSATTDGGGAYLYYGGSMDNCTLSGNLATGNYGGGAYIDNDGILTNCLLDGNSADYGGGVYFDYPGGLLNNCLLYENLADYGGGAYFFWGGMMNNCTLSGNEATNSGGGVFLENDGWYDESLLDNCILWGNTAVGTGNDIYLLDGSTILYTCASDGIVDGENGCIDSDPLFVDASSNNYRLLENSDCIDTGDGTTVVGEYDLDGEARIQNGTVDMGAYEGGDEPLPVNLSSFYATYIGGTPTIYWTTQSETENAYWNVYRGTNSNFEESSLINANDPVPGNGTTTTSSDYVYIDNAPVIQNTTYWYWIEDVSTDGETEVHEPITLFIPFEDTPITPDTYGLHQNYPNPFNPSTSISFNLPEESNVELIIYNIKGEKVKQLINDQLPTGQHSVVWDGNDAAGTPVSSGVYLYKLITDTHEYQRKMLLVK